MPMHKIWTMVIFVLVAGVIDCHPADPNAAYFHAGGWDDAKQAKADLDPTNRCLRHGCMKTIGRIVDQAGRQSTISKQILSELIGAIGIPMRASHSGNRWILLLHLPKPTSVSACYCLFARMNIVIRKFGLIPEIRAIVTQILNMRWSWFIHQRKIKDAH
jgi:hypothetical protein